MSATLIPRLAARYGLAVEPQRSNWNSYLTQHKLQPQALLADAPHPNDEGWQLMAQLFEEFFDRVVSAYRGEIPEYVITLPLPKSAGAVTYPFTGNRVEIVAGAALDGKVTATIDGRSPQEETGCWITQSHEPFAQCGRLARNPQGDRCTRLQTCGALDHTCIGPQTPIRLIFGLRLQATRTAPMAKAAGAWISLRHQAASKSKARIG